MLAVSYGIRRQKAPLLCQLTAQLFHHGTDQELKSGSGVYEAHVIAPLEHQEAHYVQRLISSMSVYTVLHSDMQINNYRFQSWP